jgi:hypothetical protein
LSRDTAASHRVLLLLDAGGLSRAQASSMSRAAAAFARAVSKAQPVSIYAFYGAGRLEKLGELERDAKSSDPVSVEGLAEGRGDTSRDLNGAVVLGLEQLAAELGAADRAVRLGTLVIVARGPDLAGRVSSEQLHAELDATRAAVLAVGVGEESGSLARIGRDGELQSASFDTLDKALERAAARVDALHRGRYLIAYCSPARAGERMLRVEVRTTGVRGEPVTGVLETPFDATGFGPGCVAARAPQFAVTLVAGRHGWIPAAVPETMRPPGAEAEVEVTHAGESDAQAQPGPKKRPGPRAARGRAPPAAAPAQQAPPAQPAAPPAPAPAPAKPAPPPTDFEP